MKTRLILLQLTLLSALCLGSEANPRSLGITRQGNTCKLSWSNSACSSVPICQVLGANTPDGIWEHVAWLTNTASFALPATNQARFFRICWHTNDIRLFNFSQYGTNQTCPVVTGWFSLEFVAPNQYHAHPVAGTFLFKEGPCDNLQAYTNSGSFCWYNSYTDAAHSTVLLTLRCGANPAFLTGTFRTTLNDAGCPVTQIYGDAWQDGFAGPTRVGTFIANSSPLTSSAP